MHTNSGNLRIEKRDGKLLSDVEQCLHSTRKLEQTIVKTSLQQEGLYNE